MAPDKRGQDVPGGSRVMIVGLGNPGPKYADTRHNIGFMVAERLGARLGVDLSREKFNAKLGTGSLGAQSAILLLPQTFMNLSGQSVSRAMAFYGVGAGELVVLHDDIDLNFGVLRFKRGGGHGGHNGLRNIDELIGTRDYYRVRIGVGRPARGDVKDWVLKRFSEEDAPFLPDVLDRTCDALTALLSDGLTATQSRFSGPLPALANSQP